MEDSFKRFLSLSTIDKTTYGQFKHYIRTYIEKDPIYSRRTWIQTNVCQCCNHNSINPLYQITYLIDQPPRRCVVVCNKWLCRIRGLLHYLQELALRDKILFFKPTIKKNKKYKIRRTDPQKITYGEIVMGWEGAIVSRGGTYLLFCKWKEGKEIYQKFVPFNIFLNDNYELKNTQFFIRDIYSLKGQELLNKDP